MRNLFVERADLASEADVEALVVDRLLAKLRYPDLAVKRKTALTKIAVARGRKKEQFRPDYVLLDRRSRPVVVLDAKSPEDQPEAYHYQVAGYALGLNQNYENENPVRYICVTNGVKLVLWYWDSATPLLKLEFGDFEEDNSAFVQLRSLISYGSIDVARVMEGVFERERPDLNELIRVFNDCHNLIWKKEKHGPTDAFYEFAKLMFVKLREDRRIADKIEAGEVPSLSDFNFSVKWIQEQVEKGVSENPIGDLLFRRIRVDLEEQITRKEKKRIFLREEVLNLRSETVVDVVERLQHFDLHGIDEDLNGRMFETFLNATVRGKELGQFFTPRSVVKYMVRSAGLRVRGKNLPVVLDGCCGSGGFLIEAMAALVHAIDARSDLTDREREKLKKRLYERHLYGIDAAEKIARVARLNMYLHGDGGSTIYAADTLDKEIRSPMGLARDLVGEVEELRESLVDDGLRFDVVLTNPPFSMSYKRSNKDEQRILNQYEIAVTTVGKASATEKSNVLFLERYYDLMAPDAELLTVIDNTVLNGVDSQRYRDFILERFVLRQVISLPFNTFFRAQANVHTSILHLKKREAGETQGHVFMAIMNNIGHDDHQHYTPERDNMPLLQQVYAEWCDHGVAPDLFEPNHNPRENLGCPFQAFIVASEDLDKRRLDAFYYSPDLECTRTAMSRAEERGVLCLSPGSDFEVVPTIKKSEESVLKGQVFRYFEIGDVTPDGAIVRYQNNLFENLPTRARLRVLENDVLFARNNSSRGTAVIIPPEFDGQLVTTGFLAVRPRNHEEALLLWTAFTSETFRKQIYYLAVTASQPEVRNEIFENEMVVPIPPEGEARERLLNRARKVHELQLEILRALQAVRETARNTYEGHP